MNIAIIGGGAAGFFAALSTKEHHPEAQVVVFEKSTNLLTKVKVSGGGRCNVTNGCTATGELAAAYPRGGGRLRKAFRVFGTTDTLKWFEARGVALYTQEDGRVFPVSNTSQTIIDCFLSEADRLGIAIEREAGIRSVLPIGEHLRLDFVSEERAPRTFDRVIVATGGSAKRTGLDWLEKLGHRIEDPVPSLFTFNMPTESIVALMGISVKGALVSIQGTKLKAEGPLLITHWGMSGPAILKLSAFGARVLHEIGYDFKLQVNWVNEANNERVMDHLNRFVRENTGKLIGYVRPYELPERLWRFLLEKSDLPAEKKWGGLGKKGMNKLVSTLTRDEYSVEGKTTFKEEFVTCGGVSLDSIDLDTMQSRVCKNLYFAGELLDVDGITGGYNFQAAWTTGFIAGQLK
ncbi:MAG: NAD(P)/FAD-dependent oxidoreductase [bacterium]|nr:NAD(P)/FAD-dependent oxidoreductase [bacterium]